MYYNNIPPAGQIDFQAQAIIAYESNDVSIIGSHWALHGQSGGWSNIETISIPDGSVSITPFINPTPTQTSPTSPFPTTTSISTSTSTSSSPTPTPTVPEFSWLVIVPLLLSVFSVAVFF